jgi:hypothetical protein
MDRTEIGCERGVVCECHNEVHWRFCEYVVNIGIL